MAPARIGYHETDTARSPTPRAERWVAGRRSVTLQASEEPVDVPAVKKAVSKVILSLCHAAAACPLMSLNGAHFRAMKISNFGADTPPDNWPRPRPVGSAGPVGSWRPSLRNWSLSLAAEERADGRSIGRTKRRRIYVNSPKVLT
jgi:hypothetical protein